MKTSDLIFFWITTGFYLVTFTSAMFYAFFDKKWMSTACTWTLRMGFLSHMGMFTVLWVMFRHVPFGKFALFTALAFLVLQLLLSDRLEHVAIFASAIIIFTLYISIRKDLSRPLSTAYASRWLLTHIFFAWFAFSCFAMATAFSWAYLCKIYKVNFLPRFTLENLDKIAYKLVTLGIIFHMIMLISGAMWANNLFGRYWNWDPIETWSLIVFLFYSTYIHLKASLRIKGKFSAWMLTLGFFLVIISLWGIPYLAPNTHLESPMGSFSK